jgi:hypothetical protein
MPGWMTYYVVGSMPIKGKAKDSQRYETWAWDGRFDRQIDRFGR